MIGTEFSPDDQTLAVGGGEPSHSRARELRAELAMSKEFRLDLALEVAAELLDHADPAMIAAGWGLYQDAATRAHDFDAVEHAHEAKLRLQPRSGWARGNYASFLLRRRDDPDRAIEMAKAALALNDYPMGRKILADAIARKKEKAE